MVDAASCSFWGVGMGKKFKLIFMLGTLFMVMLFCVSGAVPITIPDESVLVEISEPVKMLMIGFGLIGFGTLLKIYKTR